MSQPMLTGGCVTRRILPFLLLMATACGPAVAETSLSIGDTTPPTTIRVAPSTTTTAAQRTTTSPPLQAEQVLVEGLAASSANYRFVSTVTIDEEPVTRIRGRVDGNSVSATIETGDREVSYTRTRQGEWVTDARGEWVALEGKSPLRPPLAPLSKPESLAVKTQKGERVVLEGVLGAAARETAGVPFQITIVDGRVSQVAYRVDSGGHVTVVTTRLSDIGRAGRVTAPKDI